MLWPDSRDQASKTHQFGDQPDMPLAALSKHIAISPPFSEGDSHMEKRLPGPFDVTDEDVHQW